MIVLEFFLRFEYIDSGLGFGLLVKAPKRLELPSLMASFLGYFIRWNIEFSDRNFLHLWGICKDHGDSAPGSSQFTATSYTSFPSRACETVTDNSE